MNPHQRRSRVAVAVYAAALAAGCIGCSSPTEQPSESPGSTSAATAQVGRFASENPGSVNTYWVQTPQGLVVIDTGRNVAGGRRAAEDIGGTGQPVLAILITHPHPDHLGGASVLHQAFPQAPIYASDATTRWMRADPLMFYQLARSGDPDYPAQLTYPDRTFGPDETLDVGTLWETAEFGPGESETATAYYQPETGALFSGDLTNNHATPALLEGNSCGWLTNLDKLRNRFRMPAPSIPDTARPATPVSRSRHNEPICKPFATWSGPR